MERDLVGRVGALGEAVLREERLGPVDVARLELTESLRHVEELDRVARGHGAVRREEVLRVRVGAREEPRDGACLDADRETTLVGCRVRGALRAGVREADDRGVDGARLEEAGLEVRRDVGAHAELGLEALPLGVEAALDRVLRVLGDLVLHRVHARGELRDDRVVRGGAPAHVALGPAAPGAADGLVAVLAVVGPAPLEELARAVLREGVLRVDLLGAPELVREHAREPAPTPAPVEGEDVPLELARRREVGRLVGEGERHLHVVGRPIVRRREDERRLVGLELSPGSHDAGARGPGAARRRGALAPHDVRRGKEQQRGRNDRPETKYPSHVSLSSGARKCTTRTSERSA